MTRFSINIIIILIISISAGIVIADDSGGFSYRAGFGYDFISQEYFLDSLVTDSLQSVLLTKDYFNDKKAILGISYNYKNEGEKMAKIGWEQTPELYRMTGMAYWALDGRAGRFDTELNFEQKNRFHGDLVEGEDYLMGSIKGRYRPNISKYWQPAIRFKVERAAFDSIGSFAYNYNKYSGTMELTHLTDNFGSYYARIGLEKRDVADSSEIDYLAFKSNLGYFGSLGGGQLSTDLYIESRNFNQSGSIDDYFSAFLDVDYRVTLSENTFLNPEFELDFYDFAYDNSYDRDYFLSKIRLILGNNLGDFVLSIGPEFENMAAETSSEFDDNYSELGLFTGLDFMSIGGLIFFFDNEIGFRSYKSESDIFSNFKFERLDLIGNYQFTNHLRFDFIFSAEWEWHDNSDNNNRLYLLSSNLIYSF